MTIHASQEGQAPSTTPVQTPGGLTGLLLKLPWNRWLAAKIGLKWFKRLLYGSWAFIGLVIVLSFVATALLAHSVNSSISQPTGPVPPAQASAPATPSVQPLPSLPPMGPVASASMTQMAVQLANLRQEAFCNGGAKGQAMLDQVWAYHSEPHPLSFSLQNAYNPYELASKKPHSTYSRDLQQMQSGVGCNGAVQASLMKVTESYSAGDTTRVVVSQFLDGQPRRIIDAYTAVYILINGRWHIDQMH